MVWSADLSYRMRVQSVTKLLVPPLWKGGVGQGFPPITQKLHLGRNKVIAWISCNKLCPYILYGCIKYARDNYVILRHVQTPGYKVVSVPDPHVTHAQKRVWYLTSAFLVVLVSM